MEMRFCNHAKFTHFIVTFVLDCLLLTNSRTCNIAKVDLKDRLRFSSWVADWHAPNPNLRQPIMMSYG